MLDVLAIYDHKTSTAAFTTAGSPWLSANSYDASATGGGSLTVGSQTITSPPSGPQGAIGGPLLHDLGRGRRLNLLVQVTTTITSAGAANVQVDFICADNGALTSNKTVLLSTPAIAKASLVAGYRWRFATVPGVVPKQFTGVQYTVTTTDLNGGAVEAALVLDMEDHADVLG